MVLTEEELTLAESSGGERILTLVVARSETSHYTVQALLDRQIQEFLQRKDTIVYQFNRYVIKHVQKFFKILTTPEAGWNCDGPTNKQAANIVRFQVEPILFVDRVRERIWLNKEKHRTLFKLKKIVEQEINLEEEQED